MSKRLHFTFSAGAFAAAFFLCASRPAEADIGIPMIMVVWPLAWLFFVPVILVEVATALRVLKRPCAAAVVWANVASTLVGIPLAWIAMLVVTILTTLPASIRGLPVSAVDEIKNPVLALLTGAWLGAYVSPARLLWGALGVLLACYPLSVWLEYLVVRRLAHEEERRKLVRWAWIANAWSYALLILGAVGYVCLYGRASR